jgi:hypothetical protein
MCDDFPDL